MAGAPDGERLHYLDHLRALAMLAGVFFHASLAYSPLMQPFWPLADRQAAPAVDVVAWVLHLVRMPLFFLVAGFLAAFVLQRRGGAALARQRLRRIAGPLVVAWPLVVLSLAASVGWAMEHVRHPSAFLLMMREWMARPERPETPPGTAHLWFLYYLLLFAVLHWVARTLELAAPARRVLAANPAWLLFGLPLLLAPALAMVSAPHPAPEGLLPQFWALLFYGAFYALGVLLHGQPDWLVRLRAWRIPGALACTLACFVFLWALGRHVAGASPGDTAPWPLALLEATLAVWLTLGCLLLGQRWLDWPHPVLRYLAQAAYWTYLLHLPLLFAIQFWLMDRDWHWFAKFALACGATLVLCLLSYQLLVRHTPLRRFVG